MINKNKNLFKLSQKLIPGGVNSPVRAFASVGGTPIFFKKALGSRLWDENGKEYIDYINSWGPMILGHSNPKVIKAVQEAGVPKDVAKHTYTLPFNDLEALEKCFMKIGNKISCVIIEPIVGNMNLILPNIDFLQRLRQLCTQYGGILIFDEVMTGFRVGLAGAQGLYKVIPDMTTLGKIIGGGLPVGAFGGRKDIMQKLAPLGPVYQAGTLSGNPVAVAAGLKTLELIQKPNFYKKLSLITEQLVDGMTKAANQKGIEFCARNVGGMFGFYFRNSPPNRFDEIMNTDREKFNKFFHFMLKQGIYFGPSAFEAGFVSASHTKKDINETIKASHKAFESLK